MNEHDSERIAGMLESLGAIQVPELKESEIVVFVTCCVREAADTRLMGQVASMKNIPLPQGSKLDKRIVCIGGCIGQRDGAKLMESCLMSTWCSARRTSIACRASSSRCWWARDTRPKCTRPARNSPPTCPASACMHGAAWLPITSGCNSFCTYYIVPPRARPRKIAHHRRRDRGSASACCRWRGRKSRCSGQNVNLYGRDLVASRATADELLRGGRPRASERIRFGNLASEDLTDEVTAPFGELPNLMPALHLPVQSGSDRVLKAAMNRRYTADHYRELVRKVCAANPDVALDRHYRGLPGRNRGRFRHGEPCARSGLWPGVYVHLFEARRHAGGQNGRPTPHETIQRRFDELVDIVQEGAHEQNQRFTGRVLDVGLSRGHVEAR